MKKILFGLVITFICITSVRALDLDSKNVVLYNLNENNIIYEQNKDEKTCIASLTKIMTTLVAIENIDDLNEKVTMTKDMFKGLAEANAEVIGLKVGDKVTYEDLLYGTLIASGADATRGLAFSISGSEEEYAKLMNEKAKELGLKNTNFVNTTGLDEDNHYSTVNDIAILLEKALENETFKQIFTTDSYTLSNKSMIVYSTLRKAAKTYGIDTDYIEGAKTGYTLDAGRCLASIALDKENNIEYLLVTTNASPNSINHIIDATEVYNYYFGNYKYHNLVDQNDLILTLPTKYGKVKEVNFYAHENISYYLDNTFDKNNVSLEYIGTDKITTGMKKGDKLGTIEISYNGETLKSIDLFLEEEIQFSIIVFLKENVLGVLITVSVLLLFIFILRSRNKRKKRKHNKK